MAIGAEYLTSIRQYMRLTSTIHDSELEDLINAARADLVLGGVLADKAEDESDPLHYESGRDLRKSRVRPRQ